MDDIVIFAGSLSTLIDYLSLLIVRLACRLDSVFVSERLDISGLTLIDLTPATISGVDSVTSLAADG